MAKPVNIFAVILLIVGLIVGAGIGMMAFPKTITETETETSTKTLVSTQIQPTTKTIEKTIRETEIRSTVITETETITKSKTITLTKTVTSTELITKTVTRKVYPSESETILLSDSGSGTKDTRPFTLNETSDLRIIFTIYPKAELKYVGINWYLVPVGAESYFDAIKSGTSREESGKVEFYAAAVPSGSYYIHVTSANCRWSVKVEKVAME